MSPSPIRAQSVKKKKTSRTRPEWTCRALLGGPCPFKAAKVPRPSAVSLKVWLRGDISTPQNVMRHKAKRDWLLYLSVIWLLGRALAIQTGQTSQTFSRQSEGLATRDY